MAKLEKKKKGTLTLLIISLKCLSVYVIYDQRSCHLAEYFSIWVSIPMRYNAWGRCIPKKFFEQSGDITWRTCASFSSYAIASTASVSSLALLWHWNCLLIYLYFHAKLSIIFFWLFYREHEADWLCCFDIVWQLKVHFTKWRETKDLALPSTPFFYSESQTELNLWNLCNSLSFTNIIDNRLDYQKWGRWMKAIIVILRGKILF